MTTHSHEEEDAMVEGIPVKAINKTLADIAVKCGLDTARALVDHFGGTRIWIPANWTPEHELNVIGEENAKAICAFAGNDELTVPLRLLTKDGQRMTIRQLDREGLSQREIARRLHCSQRLVRREIWSKRPVLLNRRATRYIDHRQIDIEDVLRERGQK